MLSRRGSEQPQRVSSGKGPLLTWSVPPTPHRRGPGPVPGAAASASTCLSCCGAFPLAVRLPSPQHICSARLCPHSSPSWSWPPRLRPSCAGRVRCPCRQGPQPPRWPALPRAAGRVPCGRLPSLAHEGPSAQVLSCWALVGGLGGPHPSASGTSTVFGLLWGAPTPQLCSPVGGPHSLPAQLRGAASVRGPGLSAHQGARHLHTGAALTLGLGVAPE